MTSNQEASTTDVEKAFGEWWHDHTHSIPTVYSSINDYQRKIIREDKLKTFTAGYKSRDEEVEQLKRIVDVYEKSNNLYAEYGNDNPDSIYNFETARQAKEEVERIRKGEGK